MNALTRWIDAELARDGLRLAADDEPAWLEDTCIGKVRATDAEIPLTDDLIEVACDWDLAAGCAAAAATIIADTWRQEGGPRMVHQMLAGLPDVARSRLATEYLRLLRRNGHRISLAVVKRQFELVVKWAA